MTIPPATALAAPQPRNTILVGDALEQMQRLERGSIDCIVTSPPYFRLRNYQHDRQLGLEPTVEDWVDNLAAVVDEAGRLLTPTGTLWLNLGDSYSTHPREGAPKKSLLLGPERLALRLPEHGWTIRNKIAWAKTNAIPSSVTDRLSCTYEVIYLLTRSPHYYFNLDAIRVPAKTHPQSGRPSSPPKQPGRHTNRALGRTGRPGRPEHPRQPTDRWGSGRLRGSAGPAHTRRRRHHSNPMPEAWLAPNADTDHGLRAMKQHGLTAHPLGKNPGDVWQLASSNYRGAHFATYPEQLVTRMLLAGCPEQRCRTCRAPQIRPIRRLGAHAIRQALTPTCHCPPPTDGQPPSEPGLVLDPFLGSGTTAVVAEAHRRDWLGIELNPDFAEMAWERIQQARATRQATTQTPTATSTTNNTAQSDPGRKETT